MMAATREVRLATVASDPAAALCLNQMEQADRFYIDALIRAEVEEVIEAITISCKE
jgi:hypothetical protein